MTVLWALLRRLGAATALKKALNCVYLYLLGPKTGSPKARQMSIIEVNPNEILHQPLVVHERVQGEFWLIVSGLEVGRLSKLRSNGGKSFWLWWLTGPVNENVKCRTFGDGDSLPQAKAALALSLAEFVKVAISENCSLHWQQ